MDLVLAVRRELDPLLLVGFVQGCYLDLRSIVSNRAGNFCAVWRIFEWFLELESFYISKVQFELPLCYKGT